MRVEVRNTALIVILAIGQLFPGCSSYGEADDRQLSEFFSLNNVHQIEIEVDQLGVEALLEAPREYVSSDVSIDGVVYKNVGVRLKGGAGSFVALDGDYPLISGDGNGKPGKSAFIIDFNQFEAKQNFFGLKKLTINNLVQDPSSIHEFLGYSLFRQSNVPASRSGYATIIFNSQEKGLYALIEPADNKEFMYKWFGSNSGNLYEGEYGADLRLETYEMYDQDHGQDESKDDLRSLVSALDAIEGEADLMTALNKHFDLEQYLAFVTAEIYLGHWDGYAQSANNYQIYHDLEDDRWTFMPWGIDQLFEDQMGRYAGVMQQPGPAWSHHGGRVHQICVSSPACRTRLHQAFVELLDRVDEMNLIGLAATARQKVEDLTMAESTEHGDPNRTTESLNQVVNFMTNRRQELEVWLPCLAGEIVDQDSDGYDACKEDCDDHNPDVFPMAEELCNLIDDDCNGVRDDPGECPKCVEHEGPGGIKYSLCFETVTWEQARQACLLDGKELASLHSIEAFENLSIAMMDRIGVEMSWIGLNDRASEGSFVWSDGSPLDFENWGPESPKPWGEEQDCVVSAFFGWMDVECEQEHGYICKTIN
jgi:spore coat protein CotH